MTTVAAVALLAAAMVVDGGGPGGTAPPARAEAGPTTAPTTTGSPVPDPALTAAARAGPADPEPATPRFASRRGVDLHLPADDTVLVGFHEAAREEALALRPAGRLRANRNPTKYQAPPDGPGPTYVVLSSRGRTTPATAAADLVVEPGTAVRSPVSGRVVDVRRYLLYGEHVDHRIEIAPAGRPDRRVVVIHVEGVRVRAGEELTAGRSVLAAGPNRFPFGSHVDVEVGRRLPHVHMEVKPAGTGPTPGGR